MRAAVLTFGLGGLLAAALLVRPDARAESSEDAFEKDVAPLLKRWCFECHAGAKTENGLDLAKLAAAPKHGDASDAWRDVRRMLRRREMPPKKAPQPPEADVAKILGWIDGVACAPAAGDVDPGRVTLRRLSRGEYRRTVFDLLGVDFDSETKLPADDVTLGFDNVGDAMSLPPALLEKYLAAAEEIAPKAVVDPAAETKLAQRMAPEKEPWLKFYADGSAGMPMEFPRDGEYVIRTRAFGEQSGPDPVRMAFRVFGAVQKIVDVKAVRDAPQVYEARLFVPAGKRRASVAFVNEYSHVGNPDVKDLKPRFLYVEWIEVEGPVDPTPLPQAQRRAFGDDAKRPRDRAFAKEVVRRLADRAFRRPATDEEVERLADVVELATKRGASFERGVQLALTAVLVSPHFLFRVETDPTPDAAAHDLTDWELATRLSYFVWSSMPDDRLFAAAAKGELRDAEKLAGEAKRLLRDPRASALTTNFAAQWLELRRLDSVAPDPDRFPLFDEALRTAMRRETELFVDALVREGRPLREFLDADFTFADERLARHYGLAGVKGDAFQRVKLPPGGRGGLLSHASILTLTSNPTRTSPVKRGKFILSEILGEPPAPPPPGVGTFDESEAAGRTATLRQRLERHRTDPQCAVCHVKMDALGFALENFDAVGAWREKDGPLPVDAVGTLPDGRTIDGPKELRASLVADDAFVRCLAEKLLVYALGRAPTPEDGRALDRLVGCSAGLDATFADLVVGIVRTDGFRRRRGETK
jgi:hypothetical protein